MTARKILTKALKNASFDQRVPAGIDITVTPLWQFLSLVAY
ncbi:MAG: hypothetical protein AAF716_12370 [Cyanobacteria bacterium P01_D01_bin.1]